MVEAAALGRGIGAIEDWGGRGERTVRRWVGAYAGGGLDALAGSPRSGRPARADGPYLASLESAVESGPRELGLGFDAGTGRRVAVSGGAEALGRGRVEVVCAERDSACSPMSLEALGERRGETGREVSLAPDNGPAHASGVSRTAPAERERWLRAIRLARHSPEPNP